MIRIMFLIAIALSMFLPKLNAQIIHKERSLYRNIIVEDKHQLRCLKFDGKSTESNQSCFIKNDPQRLVFAYTKQLFSALIMRETPPSKVLIIGLGGGTMSNTIHMLYPEAYIDNVEIDPVVVNVARQYFGFIENERIKTHIADGRIFIKRAKLKQQQYDWIILDAFNGDYIPEHLLTKEFLEESKQLLTNNGLLTANTFSISKLYDYESATYHAVFGDFFNVRSNKNANRVILTSKQALPNYKTLADNALKLEKKLAPYNINSVELLTWLTSTADEQDWPKDTRLLTDQFSPANLLNQE